MSTPTQDAAVRNYLVSLRDPAALRDDAKIKELQERLGATDDELERLKLRQQIIDAEQPSIDGLEEAFVTHAKAWADEHGISEKAFLAEGVPARVLRRASFRGLGRRGAGRRRRGAAAAPSRPRVSADEVRKAIPKGAFTIKQLQEASGGSAAVARRVVNEELEAGRLVEAGTDPDHSGPGRAPSLYKRA